MNTYQTLTCFCIYLLSLPLLAQTPLSGVINHYTKVASIDSCEGRLVVEDATHFKKGDQVIIIQMKGATIDASNNSSFGNITELGCAGCYEKNEISGVLGSQIYLKYVLANPYHVNGLVQLVSMPRLVNAKIVDTLTTLPWDGTSGGVLAVEVTKTLELQAPVDVSGKGFRGGALSVVASDCNFLTNASDHYYGPTSWRGAPKGEGIAEFLNNKGKGRGAQANGGGGGNDHNAGGGGGANMTPAGVGGKHKASGNFACPGDNPGKGGKPLPQLSNRIFLGGGGGAGHVDDAGYGSAGGNGGGIVIIIADTIKMNGQAIIANGKTPPFTGGDGAGGGGGGGTIVLDVKHLTGNATMQAKGGDGGSVANSPDRCFGPGGGGGGGRLLSLPAINASIDLGGGQPGVNTVPSNQCSNPTSGALAGDAGSDTNITGIVQTQLESLAPVVISQPEPVIGCAGQSAVFEYVVQGVFLNYQWQLGFGTNWINLQNNASTSGVNSPKLTVLNTTEDMDGYQFRCIAKSTCTIDVISQAAKLTVIPSPQVGFDFSFSGNGAVQFTNTSTGVLSFQWEFGDGTGSTLENPEHTYSTFGTYTVKLTVVNDCGTVSTTQQITVQTAPSAAFQVPGMTGCAPASVQFFNQSSQNAQSYSWLFPGGTPDTSGEKNPTVTYSQPGTYAATLIVSNAIGSDTFAVNAAVVVSAPPTVNFTTDVTDLTVQFVNTSMGATGGFLWNFGDGNTSTELSPKHTYAHEGIFTVTLIASNDCGETTVTQTVSTGAFPTAAFKATFSGGCAPITVQFINQSTGTDLDEFEWHFEGGTPSVSYEQNPVITFHSAGTFDVTLTVGNALGIHTTTMEDFVAVQAQPEAQFSFDAAELTVKFTNNSTGGDYTYWNFGDGTVSTEKSPTHTYVTPGVYSVMLTVANGACGSALAKEVHAFLTTGSSETVELQGVNVYPNPVVSELFISLEYLPGKNAVARLWSPDGRLLQSIPVTAKLTQLPVEALSSGMYWLEIREEQQHAWRKVVKM